MKTIWKYELKTIDERSIEMPLNAEILTVQIQNSIPCIWVLVNPMEPFKIRRIRIIGTGHPIEPKFKGEYIGTYQLANGNLIFHVFDEGYKL